MKALTAFSVDYTNLDEVISFAKQLVKTSGERGICVVKHPDRKNYNIATKPEKGYAVVWQNSIGD